MITHELRQEIKRRRDANVRKRIGENPHNLKRPDSARRCPEVLIWGTRAGQPCGKRVKGEHTYCGLHTKQPKEET